jgi:hypothetical protein
MSLLHSGVTAVARLMKPHRLGPRARFGCPGSRETLEDGGLSDSSSKLGIGQVLRATTDKEKT